MKMIKYIASHIDKYLLLLFNGIIFLYLFGGVFAPIAKHFGWSLIADFLYFVYSFLCHQKPERSFFILGEQVAFCSRDLAIFTAIQIVGLTAFSRKIKLQKFKTYQIILLILPLILDGGIQLLSAILQSLGIEFLNYESTNLVRVITGTLFGLAMGNYIFSTLREEFCAGK